MNICEGCGHLFDDGEERTVTVIPGMVERVCPVCGDSYDTAVQCKPRGKWFPEHLIVNGEHCAYDYCAKCLENAITYENARQYFIDTDLMTWFIFCFFYESDVPRHVSDKLKQACIQRFDQQVALDKMRTSKFYNEQAVLLPLIKEMIMDGNGHEDFAYWLGKQEAGNGRT